MSLEDGHYVLQLSIYDSVVGGSCVWGPQVFDDGNQQGHSPKVWVSNGFFNLKIGPIDVLGRELSEAFDQSNRFLEITSKLKHIVGSRIRLSSQPYASINNTSRLEQRTWADFFNVDDHPTDIPKARMALSTDHDDKSANEIDSGALTGKSWTDFFTSERPHPAKACRSVSADYGDQLKKNSSAFALVDAEWEDFFRSWKPAESNAQSSLQTNASQTIESKGLADFFGPNDLVEDTKSRNSPATIGYRSLTFDEVNVPTYPSKQRPYCQGSVPG